MSLLQKLARSLGFRLISGGLLGGFAFWLFLPGQIQSAVLPFAVSLAVLTAAAACALGENWVEALAKSIVFGLMLALTYPLIHKAIARGREIPWPALIFTGFGWGIVTGSLAGAGCRAILDAAPGPPPAREKEDLGETTNNPP